MSFGSQTISQKDQKILSLSVNQSSAGLAIPIIWGKTRVPSNMLDYVDFKAVEHTETQGSSGKGGDVKQTSTTYTYQAAMILALGAGEISAVGKVWDDKSVTSLSALGLELKSGAVGQSPWAYMSAHHPERALGYSGIAYVAGAAFDLRSSASTPSLSFEVSGRGVVGNGVEDAGGWTVITDLLTDPYIGAGVPSSMLGDLSDYTAYCKAMGLYVSPALTSQTSCSSVLSDLMTATLSEVVESEGKIKVIPYGDEPIGDWVPNSTPVVDLDEGHFLDQDAPLSIRRKRPADAYNEVSVEYLDRDNDYNTAIYTAQDQAAIDRFGRRPKGQISLHSICDGDMAQAVAQHILQREANLCNEYVFRLDHRFAYLEPMDLITLSFAAKGLDKLPVRIKEVEVSDGFEIEVTCEEWPFGIATPAKFSVQNNSGFSQNTNVSPGNANSPVIFEPPLSLSGSPEIWIGASGGEHWGGADVWVSLDNATYSKVGTIKTSARHGILTAALPSGSDPDNTNALAVDLSVSGGTLTPATTDARDMMQTLLYAGGELVAYAGATLTGPCQYSLTGLRRGCYGSTIGAHASGQKAMRLDDGVFRYPYDPATTVGKTLYIKLQSRNKFGSALQDLANLTAYTYTVAGVPLGSVAGLALETPFTGLVFAAKWTAYPGATRYQLDFYSGATLKKTLYTSDTRVELTVDKLIAMGLGRAVTLKLTAISANGQSSTPAVLAATKAQLAAPTISVQDAGGSMIVTASQSADAAYKSTRICISQTSGFDPASTTPYYDGPQTAYPSPTLAAGTWYVRACQYDLFGADSLNWTSQVAVSITSLASGVQKVTDASTITGTVGGSPPGGDAYWAVYSQADQKMWRWNSATGRYTKAADGGDLIAASVAADKLAVAQLSAISANLGVLVAGVVDFSGGSGWNYIRTSGKWWSDVNGWIQAANPSTNSFFQDFRASSGNALIWERRGGGPDLGGMAYLSYVKDSNGVERFVIDPANGIFKLRGRIEALEGSFAGSLEAASGTLGTITAGLLKNSTDTTRFNLSETGSNEVIRINGTTRVWGDGKTSWANCLTPSGLSVTFNQIIFSTTVGDYGNKSYTTSASMIFDTGIVYDALNDAYNADFTASAVAYGMTMYGTWSAANIAPANVHISLQRLQPIPVATNQTWGTQTVKFLVTASVDGFPSAYTNASWWLRLDSLIIKVFKRT